MPMDTHGKTSALETICRPLAGQRGSGKCGNPSDADADDVSATPSPALSG